MCTVHGSNDDMLYETILTVTNSCLCHVSGFLFQLSTLNMNTFLLQCAEESIIHKQTHVTKTISVIHEGRQANY